MDKTGGRVSTDAKEDVAADPLRHVSEDKQTVELQTAMQTEEARHELILHGPKLWMLLAVLYMGIYLLSLELTMLSTVIPTLTNEFGTVADISWYEAAYVLPLCVMTPVVGKLYGQFRVKYVYLSFIIIFEIGLLICALSKSSHMFIVGRAVNGLGAAGQFNGCMLIMSCVCDQGMRPLTTSLAMSMVPIGSMTGPIIAGVVTSRIGWRWCFWILLPLGGAVILVNLMMTISEQSQKAPFFEAFSKLPRTLDPVGFLLFAAAVTTLLLALTWGGSEFSWSSATIIGLLCGGVAMTIFFCCWLGYKKDDALIPLSNLKRRSVYISTVVIFFQGGASQALPFFLPLWFQAVKGDNPSQSAVHLLPSLGTQILGLVLFGSLVRKFRYIPPWEIFGSSIATIGAGLYTTLKPDSPIGKWVGFQVICSIGRGIALQVPISAVQELVPLKEQAICLSVLTVFLQLGTAVSVSASQTIFNNRLPTLLHQYAPGANVTAVVNAGATDARKFVEPTQLQGFLQAYNQAVTAIFYLPAATCAVACFAGAAMEWKTIRKDAEKNEDETKEERQEV